MADTLPYGKVRKEEHKDGVLDGRLREAEPREEAPASASPSAGWERGEDKVKLDDGTMMAKKTIEEDVWKRKRETWSSGPSCSFQTASQATLPRVLGAPPPSSPVKLYEESEGGEKKTSVKDLKYLQRRRRRRDDGL